MSISTSSPVNNFPDSPKQASSIANGETNIDDIGTIATEEHEADTEKNNLTNVLAAEENSELSGLENPLAEINDAQISEDNQTELGDRESITETNLEEASEEGDSKDITNEYATELIETTLVEEDEDENLKEQDEVDAPEDIAIDDVEMSLFDHLEELRMRIFYAFAAIFVSVIVCFTFVNKIVGLLEVPAQGVKFLQLAPGEYFFVSIKVAGYSGILAASPVILYQIVRFVLPGLTLKEKKFVAPIILGSSVLFFLGIFFAYIALIPAALNFFISYGGDVVEQLWSIDRYFEFVLLLLFSTGLAFQIPVIQVLLSLTGIVNSKRLISGWRFVILGAVVLGGVLTPSTDPLTQSLLAGAVGGLYFGGIGLVKLIGR